MAQKRMFSLKVIDTDLFLEMPQSTRLLYYELCMRADDDGFVASPKKIMKMTGCSEDDHRILMAKQYIIPFESGVCVIKHWRIHNLIRSDRYQETEYKREKSMLEENNGRYELGIQNVIPYDNQMEPQVRLGKDRLDKDRVGKVNKPKKINYAEFVSMTDEEYNKLLTEHGLDKLNKIISTLDNYKGSNNKKYASDYRAILSWVIDRVNKESPKNTNYNKNVQAAVELAKKYENENDRGDPVW